MSVFHVQIEELEKKYEEGQSLDNDQVCLLLSNRFYISFVMSGSVVLSLRQMASREEITCLRATHIDSICLKNFT